MHELIKCFFLNRFKCYFWEHSICECTTIVLAKMLLSEIVILKIRSGASFHANTKSCCCFEKFCTPKISFIYLMWFSNFSNAPKKNSIVNRVRLSFDGHSQKWRDTISTFCKPNHLPPIHLLNSFRRISKSRFCC